MGWLLGWLIFGLLAAYEVGQLAMHAGGDWTPMRSIACLVGSVTALSVIAQGAVRHARPGELRPLLGICLLGLVACLWGLYGSSYSAGWITMAMAGATYLLACLFIGSVAMLLAWRRHVAHEERVALACVGRARKSRLERVRAETSARAAANSVNDGLSADSDFILPTRPKWDEN